MTQIITTELPIRRNYKLKRGSDWSITLWKKQDDGITAFDTTGYTCTLTIKSKINGEVYATLTESAGITHTPASGSFTPLITAAMLDTYQWANAIYDFQLTSGGGSKSVILSGEMSLE